MTTPRVLVGPLLAPEQIGAWLFDPQVRALADPRVWQPPPAWRGLVNSTNAKTLPWLPYHYGDSLADILAQIDDWEPEIILWWGFGYTVLPEDLAQAPCPVVLIASDWQSCLSELWAWRETFDLILGDQGLVDRFQARGFKRVAWWPSYGFSSAQFYPDPGAQKRWDLTFIGSLNPDTHPERLRLLSQLAPLAKTHRICLRDQVYGAEYLQILQQSRLVFNHALRGEMNLRAYQAPAAGALLLQESGNLEIQRCLKPGEEYLSYHPETVLADISTILARPDLTDLAEAGQKAIQRHSYDLQFERLLCDLPAKLAQLTQFQRPPGPVFAVANRSQRQLRQALHPALTAGQAAWLNSAFLSPPAPRLSAEIQACLRLSLHPHLRPNLHVNGRADSAVTSSAPPATSESVAAWQTLKVAAEKAAEQKAPEAPLLGHDLAWAAYLLGQTGPEVERLADQALVQLSALPTDWSPESPETLQVLPWLGAESFQLTWDAACFQGDPAQIRALLGWNLWRLKAELAWSERRLPAALEALEQAVCCAGPPTLWLPLAQTAAVLGLAKTAEQALSTHLQAYPLDRKALDWGLQWALATKNHPIAQSLLAQLEAISGLLGASEAEYLSWAALKAAL